MALLVLAATAAIAGIVAAQFGGRSPVGLRHGMVVVVIVIAIRTVYVGLWWLKLGAGHDDVGSGEVHYSCSVAAARGLQQCYGISAATRSTGQARLACTSGLLYADTQRKPAMPATISPTKKNRANVAASANNQIPSTKVPTAPMPVHTA